MAFGLSGGIGWCVGCFGVITLILWSLTCDSGKSFSMRGREELRDGRRRRVLPREPKIRNGRRVLFPVFLLPSFFILHGFCRDQRDRELMGVREKLILESLSLERRLCEREKKKWNQG